MGAIAVKAFDQLRDRLIFANGDEVSVERYIAEFPSSGLGHLFQELLTPHSVIKEICGDRISSIRIIILLCKDGPHLIRAVWKIPTGRNMIDNFFYGRSGNMLGQIDLETGIIKRVIQGVGLNTSEVVLHPDTARPVTNFALPNWEDLVNLCLTASTALPGLRLQHWDIAMCQKGPVIHEVNCHGKFNLLQHAYRAGIYDAQFRSYLTNVSSG